VGDEVGLCGVMEAAATMALVRKFHHRKIQVLVQENSV
jgi:hypothetical protein